MSLSERIRAGSEAAPWVVEEVKKLEGEIARLQGEQRQMGEDLIQIQRIHDEQKTRLYTERHRYRTALKEAKEALETVENLCANEGKHERQVEQAIATVTAALGPLGPTSTDEPLITTEAGLRFRLECEGEKVAQLEDENRELRATQCNHTIQVHADGREEHGCGCEAMMRGLAKVSADLNEADRRAGAAERMSASYQDSACARDRWLRKAKEEWGVDNNVSFDVVWDQALKARDELAAIQGKSK